MFLHQVSTKRYNYSIHINIVILMFIHQCTPAQLHNNIYIYMFIHQCTNTMTTNATHRDRLTTRLYADAMRYRLINSSSIEELIETIATTAPRHTIWLLQLHPSIQSFMDCYNRTSAYNMIATTASRHTIFIDCYNSTEHTIIIDCYNSTEHTIRLLQLHLSIQSFGIIASTAYRHTTLQQIHLEPHNTRMHIMTLL